MNGRIDRSRSFSRFNSKVMTKNLSDFDTEDLVIELEERNFRSFEQTNSGMDDCIRWIIDELNPSAILSEIPDDEIIDYVEDDLDHVVFGSREDALESLQNEHNDIHLLFPTSKNGSNFYRSEAIDLIMYLAEKNGWDFVYSLIESYKVL